MTRVTPGQFQRILAFLKHEGYQTVPLSIIHNPPESLPPRPIVLTFDDSYESLYTFAFPVMEMYGFTGTIFVISDYVGQSNSWDVNLGWLRFQHLSWQQLSELSRAGFAIESHTAGHPDLTRIDAASIHRELDISKKTIEDKMGQPVQFVSFPFGRYNDTVIQVGRNCGYRNGCGFWIRRCDKKKQESFVLERKAYYLFDGLWNLRAKLGNHPLQWMEDAKLRIINYCSHGSALIKSIHQSDKTTRDNKFL